MISKQTREILCGIFSSLSAEETTIINCINNKILSNIYQYFKITDFKRPAEKIEAIFLEKTVHYKQENQIIMKRALVAKLALQLPAIVERMNLPASILALYPAAFRRLADFLKNLGHERYDSSGEFFCKDIRFVIGLSIPCGARIIDMNSSVPLHSVILSLFRSRKIDGLIQYVCARGTGPWFRNHADSRYLNEYNEKALDNFYLRVAELLKQKINIRGLAGGSWYYDPQVLKISPRLAYLQERPRERGAFFLQHGTHSSDIAHALKRSETRRKLYKENKYTPTYYSMLWPRDKLISWADKTHYSMTTG